MLGIVIALFIAIGFASPASAAGLPQGAPGQEIVEGVPASVVQSGAEPAAATVTPADLVPHNLLTEIGEASKAQADADAAQFAPAPPTSRQPAAARFHPPGTNLLSPGRGSANAAVVPPDTAEADAPPFSRKNAFTDMWFEESGFIPPDVTMAAGPSDLLSASNGRVKIFNKTRIRLASSTLDQFFRTTGSFDPWAVYDPYIQRFWLFAVNQANPSTSTYLIALSNTNSANDAYLIFELDARVFGSTIMNQWCDYPKLGIDSQAIYLTCNMFSLPNDATSSFQTTKIRVMTKTQFINNTCCSWWDFWNINDGAGNRVFTIQPAVMIGAVNANGEFLVGARGSGGAGSVLEVFQITNAQNCCLPMQTGPGFAQAARSVGSYSSPPDAVQPGGVTPINTGDTRLLYAFWQNGKLATGQNFACGNPMIACIVFDEFDVSAFPTIGLLNDWFLASGGYAYYPMVAANSAGNRTMVYSRSSATEFAGAWFVGIPPTTVCTGCFDGPETTLHVGQNTYVRLDNANPPRNRWGDYSGASPDPDGTGIWIRGEYASPNGAPNSWGTAIGITYEVLPSASTSVAGASSR